MKQPQYQPMSVAEMALSLFAVNEGYLDEIEVGKSVEFEAAMQAYVKSSHGGLLDEINGKPEYGDEVAGKMKGALDDFKENGSW